MKSTLGREEKIDTIGSGKSRSKDNNNSGPSGDGLESSSGDVSTLFCKLVLGVSSSAESNVRNALRAASQPVGAESTFVTKVDAFDRLDTIAKRSRAQRLKIVECGGLAVCKRALDEAILLSTENEFSEDTMSEKKNVENNIQDPSDSQENHGLEQTLLALNLVHSLVRERYRDDNKVCRSTCVLALVDGVVFSIIQTLDVWGSMKKEKVIQCIYDCLVPVVLALETEFSVEPILPVMLTRTPSLAQSETPFYVAVSLARLGPAPLRRKLLRDTGSLAILLDIVENETENDERMYNAALALWNLYEDPQMTRQQRLRRSSFPGGKRIVKVQIPRHLHSWWGKSKFADLRFRFQEDESLSTQEEPDIEKSASRDLGCYANSVTAESCSYSGSSSSDDDDDDYDEDEACETKNRTHPRSRTLFAHRWALNSCNYSRDALNMLVSRLQSFHDEQNNGEAGLASMGSTPVSTNSSRKKAVTIVIPPGAVEYETLSVVLEYIHRGRSQILRSQYQAIRIVRFIQSLQGTCTLFEMVLNDCYALLHASFREETILDHLKYVCKWSQPEYLAIVCDFIVCHLPYLEDLKSTPKRARRLIVNAIRKKLGNAKPPLYC